MKVTDDVRDSIAKDYLEPIIKRLSQAAYDEIVEGFCKEHCGKAPEVRLCSPAKEEYRCLLHFLIESQSRLN